MTKGKRQRANSKSPTKVGTIVPKISIPSILKEYPVRTLNAGDVNQLKQLVGLSNNILKLIQECAETDKNIAKGNEVSKNMLRGKVKGPAMQKITSNLYLPVTDMKGVAKQMKSEIKTLKEINAMARSNLTRQYNDYINIMRGVKDSFNQILASAPKIEPPKIIFEKDISKMTKKDREFVKKIKADIDKKSKK